MSQEEGRGKGPQKDVWEAVTVEQNSEIPFSFLHTRFPVAGFPKCIFLTSSSQRALCCGENILRTGGPLR